MPVVGDVLQQRLEQLQRHQFALKHQRVGSGVALLRGQAAQRAQNHQRVALRAACRRSARGRRGRGRRRGRRGGGGCGARKGVAGVACFGEGKVEVSSLARAATPNEKPPQSQDDATSLDRTHTCVVRRHLCRLLGGRSGGLSVRLRWRRRGGKGIQHLPSQRSRRCRCMRPSWRITDQAAALDVNGFARSVTRR